MSDPADVRVYDPDDSRADFTVGEPVEIPATFSDYVRDLLENVPLAPLVFSYFRDGQMYIAYGINGNLSLSRKASLLANFTGVGNTGAARQVARFLPGLSANAAVRYLGATGEWLSHFKLEVSLPAVLQSQFDRWKRGLTVAGVAPVLNLDPAFSLLVTESLKSDATDSRVDTVETIAGNLNWTVGNTTVSTGIEYSTNRRTIAVVVNGEMRAVTVEYQELKLVTGQGALEALGVTLPSTVLDSQFNLYDASNRRTLDEFVRTVDGRILIGESDVTYAFADENGILLSHDIIVIAPGGRQGSRVYQGNGMRYDSAARRMDIATPGGGHRIQVGGNSEGAVPRDLEYDANGQLISDTVVTSHGEYTAGADGQYVGEDGQIVAENIQDFLEDTREKLQDGVEDGTYATPDIRDTSSGLELVVSSQDRVRHKQVNFDGSTTIFEDGGHYLVTTSPSGQTEIRTIGNPLPVDFSDVGGAIGAQLGYRLGGDSLILSVGASALFETLGNNFGDSLDELLGGGSVTNALSDAFRTFDAELLANLKDAGTGALSSFLTAELIRTLGLEGFEAELASTVSGAVINTIISNLTTIAAGGPAAEGLTIFSNVGPSVVTAASSFVGNQLANEIANWDEVGEQIGSSVGGALGGIIGQTAIPVPVIGAIIGTFLGNLMGGLIGGVFTGTPKSGAIVEYDTSSGEFRVVQVWKEDGGSRRAARELGETVSDTLNGIVSAIGGELVDGEAVDAGSYGMRGKRYVFWQDGSSSENRIKFKEAEDLVEYGVLNALQDFQFLGGDVYAKRAFYSTLSKPASITTSGETGGTPELVPGQLYDTNPLTTVDNGLDTLLGNLTIVDRLHVYLEHSASINALIAAEPDSVFSAEWMLVFARIDELGLWRRSTHDWDGGFGYLLNSSDADARDVQFVFNQFEIGLAGERLTLVGDELLWDTIDSGSKTLVWGSGNSERLTSTAQLGVGHTTNTFYGGDGDDEIVGQDSGDDLFGEAGDDQLVGGQLDDWLFGGEGNDVLDAGGGSGNLLSGDEGADQLVGRSGSDWLAGGEGSDRLLGGAGDDVLEGERGSDIVDGGAGSDTVIYHPGAGIDQIADTGNGASELDRLEFGAGVGAADLVVVAGSSGERVSAYVGAPESGNRLDLRGIAFGRTSGIDELSFLDETWTRGDLTSRAVFSKTSGSTLAGTSGDDELAGSIHDDALSGAGGNDLLAGGAGSDRYTFGLGDGVDTIVEGGFATDLDTLVFGPGITAANIAVAYSATSAEDLIVTVGAFGDQVVLKGQVSASISGEQSIEQILFDDGTSWTLRDLLAQVPGFTVTTGADVIYGTNAADVVASGNGNDSNTGRFGDDSFDGGSGLDTYYYGVGDGDDRIIDSTHREASGNKLVFGAGILPSQVVAKRDKADSNNLVLTFTDFPGSVTLDDQFYTSQYASSLYDHGIETIQFAEGTIWSRATLITQMLSQASSDLADYAEGTRLTNFMTGGEGRDILSGGDGADTITGGADDDLMDGGSGSDTYHYSLGDGNDGIIDSRHRENPTNTLILGVGITASDLRLERDLADGNNMIVTFSNGAGSLLLDNQLYTSQYGYDLFDHGIDIVRFYDGSQVTRTQLITTLFAQSTTSENDVIEGSRLADTLTTGAGDDIVWSGDGNDSITGGLGDDNLDGGGNADTYYYSLGDGNDRIMDSRFRDTSANKLVFGTGITAADLLLEYDLADTGNVIVRFAGQQGSILLDEQLAYNSYAYDDFDDGIEIFQFADGSQLTRAQFVTQLFAQVSTANTDYVLGTRQGDTLSSGAGSDRIAAGGGNDNLTGGTGDDSLDGGYGTDSYNYAAGDGHDRIYDYSHRDSQTNELLLGSGITAADIVLERDHADTNNVRLSFTTMSGSLLLDDEMAVSSYAGTQYRHGIGVIRFNDGTSWNRAQIDAAIISAKTSLNGTTGADVLSGTTGRDDIYGNSGNDTIRGGAGSDLLRGGDGNDLYEYNLGDGFDVIVEGTGTDTIKFGAGIATTDLVLSRPLQDGDTSGIVIAIGGTNDRLYVKAATAIERYEFDDGTVWTEADMRSHLYEQLATAGADVINGTGFGETIGGEEGNDIISSSSGDDTLDGGVGDDLLQGGDGNDVYLFGLGSGRDVIVEASGTDTVRFGAGITISDLIIRRPMADGDTSGITIRISGTADELYVKAATGIERYEFADGTVWLEADMRSALFAQSSTAGSDIIHGTGLADTLSGAAGADRLYAGAGNDILGGGTGNDVVEGGDGNDRYLFDLGDGRDVLYDTTGTDTVAFGSGLELDGLRVIRPPADGDTTGLLLIFATGDQLYVKNAVAMERYEFADGTVLSEAQMRERFLTQARTNGDDVIYGSTLAETLRGGGGEDRIYAGSGNDVLDGGRGDDVLDGSVGNDTFVFNRGDGRDVLWDSAGTDTVLFGPGITPDDLVVSRPLQDGDTGGLFIGIKDTRDRIYLRSSVFIERFEFADGTVLNPSQLTALLTSTTVAGAAYAVTLGEDTVLGTAQADTFQALSGDDVIRGGAGSDTYRFSLGDGYDTIFDPVSDADVDTLILTNIASTGVRVLTAPGDADDVVIFIDDGNQIYLDQQKVGASGGIDQVQFSDGVTWSRADLLARSSNEGTSGSDSRTGTNFADILHGGLGNDVLTGLAGGDSYTYDLGDGDDTVVEGVAPGTPHETMVATDDRIVFGAGIGQADIRLAHGLTAGDVVLTFATAAGSITLRDQNAGSGAGVEYLVFNGGSSVSLATLLAQSIAGAATSGNDLIVGFLTADELDGGLGDDVLEGGEGSDRYHFGVGYGVDLVRDYGKASPDVDELLLGGNVTTANLVIRRPADNPNDLVLAIGGTTDEIRLVGQLGSSVTTGIETVRFTDGTVWSRAQLFEHYLAQPATAGGDYIMGTDADETLDGLGGDDIVDGGRGDDILSGGEGNDEVRGGSGDDTLFGGEGDDRLSGGLGVDQFDGGQGYDTIDFGFSLDSWSVDLASGVAAIITDGAAQRSENFVSIEAVVGGAGADQLSGDAQSNRLEGAENSDVLFGGDGDDTFVYRGSDTGLDVVDGGAGTDAIEAVENDTIIGLVSLTGVEAISGNGHTGVIVTGTDVADTMNLGEIAVSGISLIYLAAGDDVLVGSAGSDVVDLGVGNDIYRVSGDHPADSVTGGDGTDRIEAAADGTVIRLSALAGIEEITAGGFTGVSIAGSDAADTLSFAATTLTGIVRIDAGSGNDVITGSAQANVIVGGAGNDTLSGGGGDDVFEISSDHDGIDTVDGGTGTDRIQVTTSGVAIRLAAPTIGVEQIAGMGSALIYGALNDSINLAAVALTGIVSIDGGAGTDTIVATAGADTIIGGPGNDTVTGNGGNDTYLYNLGDGQDILLEHASSGGGTDALVFGAGISPDDVRLTKSGTDVILTHLPTGGSVTIKAQAVTNAAYWVEEVRFADGTVWDRTATISTPIYGTSAANTLTGTAAADVIFGLQANDTVSGAAGADRLFGGEGDDTLDGGTENDSLSGGDGNDTLLPGAGVDTVDGGLGIDLVDYASLTGVNVYADLGLADKQARYSDGSFETWLNVEGALTGTGNDQLIGANTASRLEGGAGLDRLEGRGGADTLEGQAGDDHLIGGNGADLLYGGDGADQLVGDGYEPTGPNLLVNASFETPGPSPTTASWGLSVATIPGWTKTNTSPFELVNSAQRGVISTEGTKWLDLEGTGTGGNMSISQEVTGRTVGEVLELKFDAANSMSAASGSFEVLWNGAVIATINATGIEMRTYTYQVTAQSGANSVGFRSLGTLDGGGASLDNVRLTATVEASGNDRLDGGAGSDTVALRGLSSGYQLVTAAGAITLVDLLPSVDGDDGTDTLVNVETLRFKDGELVSVFSPILLDLDGDGVETLRARDSHARFDLDADGRSDDTSWVGKDDGLLYLDRNGDGTVSGASEITFIDDWPNATSDLAGLRAFDGNDDGRLDAADALFTSFGVWNDRNGNGEAEAGETRSLATAGITALSLAGTAVDGTYAFGDAAILNSGTFALADGTTRALADVALTYFSASREAPSDLGPARLWPLAAVIRGKSYLRRQELLEATPIEDPAPSPAKLTQDLPLTRLQRALLEAEASLKPEASDVGLAKKLALMRQDLGAFGPVHSEGFDRRVMAEPNMADWYA